MRNQFVNVPYRTKLVALIMFLNLPSAFGVYLENIDINTLKNSRIAYYPGSFDPLHIGHTAVVKTVLDSDLADYVLIYALPDSDSSKTRTPFAIRTLMLESQYRDDPRVLITKLNPAEMQGKLSPLFSSLQFSVVQGSDNVNQYVKTSQYDSIWMKGVPLKGTKYAKTSTGAIMAIPATRVIAFNRAGEDLSYVGSSYKDRPITILTTPMTADISSTQAREAIQKGENLTGLIPPEVINIIQENRLYSKRLVN